jgi:hypothetical protein
MHLQGGLRRLTAILGAFIPPHVHRAGGKLSGRRERHNQQGEQNPGAQDDPAFLSHTFLPIQRTFRFCHGTLKNGGSNGGRQLP